jgi:ribosome-binding protein aMBF1 (putative translation factor)
MRNEKELAAAVRSAMKKRKITKDQLASMLDMNPIMIEKFLCGEIEPSRHLEKQMIEILRIDEHRVFHLGERRRHRSPAKKQSPRLRNAA